jgi:hypothetical protein
VSWLIRRGAGIALLALVALPASALATTDRADYATQVNTICARTAGNDFAELAALRAVPAAPGDEALVSSWLDVRQRRLDLSRELTKIDRQANKLVKRTRTTLSIEVLIRIDRKVKKLDKRAGQVENKVIALESQDDDLGTQLGATECVIDIK